MPSGSGQPTSPFIESDSEGTVANWTTSRISTIDPMPNQYFQFFQNKRYDADRGLYDVLLSEANNIHGNPMMYYRVTYDVNYDPLFGEDDVRRIERRFPVKAVFELPKQLELYAKFGIEGLDNFPMYVSKNHFAEASKYPTSGVALYPPAQQSQRNVYGALTPKVGDIIRCEFNGVYYEIIDVGEEDEMFLQGKHSWTFTVRTMLDQKLSLSADTSAAMTEITGVNDVDDYLDQSDYITNKKDDVLYTSGSSEESSNQPGLGGWFD